MIVKAKVSTIEGGKYRLDINGVQSLPISPLSHVGPFKADFERKEIITLPLEVGENVLAFFFGGGYSSGFIIGLTGGALLWR